MTRVPDPPPPPSRSPYDPQSIGEMDVLVDASMKFTRVLKRKGVSQATLQVAVRARPLSRKEMSNGARTITKLVDERCVVVMKKYSNE